MLKNFNFAPENSGDATAEILDFINERLSTFKIDLKEKIRAQLMAEESLVNLIEHGDFEKTKKIQVRIRKFLGEITITLSVPGNEFDFLKSNDSIFTSNFNDEEMSASELQAISNILLHSFEDKLKYRHRASKHSTGYNVVQIIAFRSRHRLLYQTSFAFILAIILGTLLNNFAPENLSMALNENLFEPIHEMFIHALMMIVAPVVFFSIVSCLTQFDNFTEMGKIGGKIFAFYMLTTFVASAVGLGIFPILNFLTGSEILTASGGLISTAGAAAISIKNIIVDIIPSNILRPILEMKMLQIIFLAILCGAAVGLCGNYSEGIRKFFEAGNIFFLKITTFIIYFVPLGAFASITSLILKTGAETLISLLGMVTIFAFGILIMIIFYCVLIFLINGLNPLKFLLKYSPTALDAFSLGSANAAIPANIEACEKLGIPSKIFSLSIPLGATIKKDGTCVSLAVFSLAFAKLYGVEVSSAAVISLFFSIIILSVAAPAVQGTWILCFSILLEQLGAPLDGVEIAMGISPLIGMMCNINNCMGSVAYSLIVAAREKDFDKKVYYE